MKIYSIVFLLLVSLIYVSAQEKNDLQATQLLEKVESNIKQQSSIKVDFDFIIDIAEMEEEVITGELIRKNDKFHLTTSRHEIINTGDDVYVINPSNKMIQKITKTDFEEQMGSVDPFGFLDLYKSGEYIYAITGKETIHGSTHSLIEFKPVDRYAEYSKVRIAINQKTNVPTYLKVFSKDGSKYSFTIKNFYAKPSIDENEFEYVKDNYENYIIK